MPSRRESSLVVFGGLPGRVEARESDLEGLAMPTWEQVLAREYEPWTEERLVLDTTGTPGGEAVAAVERYALSRSVV